MPKPDTLTSICRTVAGECRECGLCVEKCLFLQETGQSPAQIAARGPLVEEAYACTLCGLCWALCPNSLNLKDMFWEARREAVRLGLIDIEEYRYMFPDRENNMMRYYRRKQGIRYDDLPADREAAAAFFPGCLLLTYAPELVRKTFTHLRQSHPDLTLLTDCCGLPMVQLGVDYRLAGYTRRLTEKLAKLGIKTLITACPNCYYQLRPLLTADRINLLTVYEALPLPGTHLSVPGAGDPRPPVALHDSCPDRREGIFARQAREALVRRGFTVRELPNSKELATCCGSGGQVTHFRPDLADELVKKRRQEFQTTGAQVFAAYCLGCVLNLAKETGAPKVQHVLNLVLDLPQDFTGAKQRMRQLFAGEEGEQNWQEVMKEREKENGL